LKNPALSRRQAFDRGIHRIESGFGGQKLPIDRCVVMVGIVMEEVQGFDLRCVGKFNDLADA
jgi:hypothetical protein